MPWSREAWKSIAKTSASSDAQILRSLPGIWSGPVALEGSMLWRSLRTPPFETMIFVICGLSVLSEGAGGVNSWSGFENTLQNVRWKDLLSSLGQWPKCRYQKYLLFRFFRFFVILCRTKIFCYFCLPRLSPERKRRDLSCTVFEFLFYIHCRFSMIPNCFLFWLFYTIIFCSKWVF